MEIYIFTITVLCFLSLIGKFIWVYKDTYTKRIRNYTIIDIIIDNIFIVWGIILLLQ